MGDAETGKGFTSLIKKIGILSIALGLAVMIISMAVVTGFQEEIRNKVIGFGSHIQITRLDYNISYEPQPINSNQDFLPAAREINGVEQIQPFATKPGIIKTDEDIHGVILKGIGPDFDWTFFEDRLVDGTRMTIQDTIRSDETIISRHIASRLQLQTGDDLFMYFIQDPPRIRRMTIAGIYDTGLEELDKMFVIGDIRHIQRLNDWNDDQIGGFEVLVSDYDDIPETTNAIYDILPYHLSAQSIRDLYPQIFDWLALLDMNVYVIIALMILVAGINMITTLLITVLDKTNAIGILKALGSSNTLMRKIFLYHSGILISRGLLWGNLAGLLLIGLQGYFGLITLSPESYYVSEVPVNIRLSHLLMLNAGTFVLSIAMLILPSYMIARISPVRAMMFR